jgi:hypothetical protein
MHIADDLMSTINKICGRDDGGASVWKSVRQALLTIWNQEEIANLQKRLDTLQRQVQLLISATVGYVHPASCFHMPHVLM